MMLGMQRKMKVRKCEKNMIYKAKVKSVNSLEWQLPNFGVGKQSEYFGFLRLRGKTQDVI